MQFPPFSNDTESLAIARKANNITGLFLKHLFKLDDAHSSGEEFSKEVSKKREIILTPDSLARLQPFFALLDKLVGRMSPDPRANNDLEIKNRLKAGLFYSKDANRLFEMLSGGFITLECREESSFRMNLESSVTDTTIPVLTMKYDALSEEFRVRAGVKPQDVVKYAFLHEFRWLENMTIEDLIEFKKQGFNREFRRMLADRIESLKCSEFKSFSSYAKELDATFQMLLSQEMSAQEEFLAKQRKSKQKAFLSFGASAGIGAASLAFPEILPLSILGTAYGVLIGGASVTDLIREHLSHREQKRAATARPFSILLSHYSSWKKS